MLGRRRPIARGPHLRLGSYLRLVDLPPIPAAADYRPAALEALRDVMGNDALGDCVIAGGYHILGTETGNAQSLFHAQADEILADYEAIGGYVPGDSSTDRGCMLVDALNYWTKTGFADGSKLLGWIAIDPTNVAEVQAAMFLFENLYFGIELPSPWLAPFPSADGFTWDVAGAGNPAYGHCVVGVGYDAQGVTIDTWGLFGRLTYGAIAAYCAESAGGELYVMLSPDQLHKGHAAAPNGVAWADLISDFDKLGGDVPVPAAPPVIPPSPAPPIPNPSPAPLMLTLEGAQAALAAGWGK